VRDNGSSLSDINRDAIATIDKRPLNTGKKNLLGINSLYTSFLSKFFENNAIAKIVKISKGTPNTKKSHQYIPIEVKTLKMASPIENNIIPVPTINNGKALLWFFMFFSLMAKKI